MKHEGEPILVFDLGCINLPIEGLLEICSGVFFSMTPPQIYQVRSSRGFVHPQQIDSRESCSRSARVIPARLVLRAKIVSLAADGKANNEIALQLEKSQKTVGAWRTRFLEYRCAGIRKDALRG